MKTDIQTVNSYTRELQITVPWEELKADFEKSARQFSKRVKIPGFRPGKAPLKVILNQYLHSIEADFVDQAFRKAYVKALDEHDLYPVNQAKIKSLDFAYERDLTFAAEFEVEPEIELPTLKKNSLKVTRTRYESDEEDVNAVVEEIRYAQAEVRPVEDGAKAGHFILGDLQELDASGVPVIGRKLEKRYLRVGDGIFTGDNQTKLEGLKPGDTCRLEIPDEQGQPVLFELSVIRVEEQVLPEVNDEFVQQVNPALKTVEEWRQSIRERIDENYERRAREQFDRDLADALIDKVNPEYPPSMVDAYLDHLIEDARKANPGETIDEDKIRAEYRSVAERNLKWYLIRNAVIRSAGLEVTREEVQEKIRDIVESAPEDQRKTVEKTYKKPSNRSRIEDDLMERKVLDYLLSFAKVKEVTVKTSDLRKMNQEDHAHEH
ncbi:MAG: trigger factor [Candidatus Neomarinimicrobiota bacterium]|nr:MAG: trigger factor [Candidatus Neomarinimicrobiota bacterium]